MARKGDVVINIEKCKGCEVCLSVCPEQVLALSNEVNAKGYHYAMKVNANCIAAPIVRWCVRMQSLRYTAKSRYGGRKKEVRSR